MMTASPGDVTVAAAACLAGCGAMFLCRNLSRRPWDCAGTRRLSLSIEVAAALGLALVGLTLAPWPASQSWMSADSRPPLADVVLTLTALRGLLLAAVALYLVAVVRASVLAMEIRAARRSRPDACPGGADG